MDVECVACGYNLRTVLAEGRCPECGLAVGRSTVGHWLRYRDPMWLQCLWRGLNRLSITIVAVCVVVLFAFLEGTGVITIVDSSYVFYALWIVVAPAFAVGFGLPGLIRSTRPDPAKLAEPILSWRRLTRLAMLGVLLSTVALIVSMNVSNHIGPAETDPLVTTVTFVLLLCAVSIPLCLLMHARKLALHVPEVRLAWMSFGIALVWALAGALESVILTNPAGLMDWLDTEYQRRWPANLHYSALIAHIGGVSGNSWRYSPAFGVKVDQAQRLAIYIMTACLLICVALFLRYWKVMKAEADFALRGWAAEVDKRAAAVDGAAVDGA